MYSAFDHYLGHETWHSNHEYDRQRFLRALREVLDDEGFNADDMGQYMRTKIGIPDSDHESAFARKIAHDVQDAWAIRDYLKMTSG